MKNFLLMFFAITLSIATSFLFAYIILDLIKLFELYFIPDVSILQIIGFSLVWGISTMKSDKDPKEDKKESIKESIHKLYYNLCIKIFAVLMAWAVSYLLIFVFN